MPTLTLTNPRGATQTVTELGALEHYLRRGYSPQDGSSPAAARQAFTGQPATPTALETQAVTLRPRRLQGLRPSRMLTTFATGHGWTGGDGASTFNLNDTTDSALGAQCLSFTTSGQGNVGGQRVVVRSPALTAFDLTQYDLAVWYRLTTPDPVQTLSVTVTDGTNGWSYNFFQQATAGQATAAGAYPSGQHIYSAAELTADWHVAVMDLSMANTYGTPTAATKTALTTVWLGSYDFGGGAKGAGKFGGVALIPKAVATYPNGVVTIGLDDGYVSQWTAAKPP